MFIIIFVFVGLLFVADLVCTMQVVVKPLEIGATGTIPCGHVETDAEVRIVQWFKSIRIDVFEKDVDILAWWTERGTGSLPNYQMGNTSYSLVIEEATLDECIYMCTVLRGDLFTESNYLIRTVTFAFPRKDPEITLDTDLNRVNCTVEHVKPLTYPVLNFDYSHASTETYAVLNEDGTYTTSVSCKVPQNESASRLDCSLSYLHYQRVASLDLLDITTYSLMKKITSTVSPMGTSVTSAGDGSRTVDHTAITVERIFISCLALTNVIMLIVLIHVPRKVHRCVQKCNNANECEQKMFQPAMEMVA